jgi:hypothetical protein
MQEQTICTEHKIAPGKDLRSMRNMNRVRTGNAVVDYAGPRCSALHDIDDPTIGLFALSAGPAPLTSLVGMEGKQFKYKAVGFVRVCCSCLFNQYKSFVLQIMSRSTMVTYYDVIKLAPLHLVGAQRRSTELQHNRCDENDASLQNANAIGLATQVCLCVNMQNRLHDILPNRPTTNSITHHRWYAWSCSRA